MTRRPMIKIPAINSTESSDHELPYSWKAEALREALKRKRENKNFQLMLEEARAKRKEEEKKLRLERIAKEDEERQKRNAEIKRKLLEEEAEKQRKQGEEDRKRSEELFEPNFLAFLKDVHEHPDRYNRETRGIVENAINQYKHPNLPLQWGSISRAKLLFRNKNALGDLIISKTDTYGLTIQGKIDLNDIFSLHIDAHEKYRDANESLEKAVEERENLINSNTDLTDEAFTNKLNELNTAIYNAQQVLNDPTLKQMDDNYRKFYVDEFGSGISHTLRKINRAFMRGITYDLYLDDFDKRSLKEDVAEYNSVLVDHNRPKSSTRVPQDIELLYNQERPFALENLELAESGARLNEIAKRQELQYIKDLDYVDRKGGINQIDKEETLRWKADIAAQNKVYQQELKENRIQLANEIEAWDVAEYYKRGKAGYQNAPLYSPYYWYYEAPAMIGSTYSSPEQIKATIINAAGTIGSLALAPFSAGLSTALFYGSSVASLPSLYTGGLDENRAEIHERRIENVKQILKSPTVNLYDLVIKDLLERSTKYWLQNGMTEDQVKEYLSGEEGLNRAISDYLSGLTSGNTNPALAYAQLYSTQGLAAQYEADNMRTMAELGFLSVVMFTPTSMMRNAISVLFDKLGSRILSKEALKAAENEASAATRTAENVARNGRYSNGYRVRGSKTLSEAFGKGYERGVVAGESAGLGFVGSLATGVAGGFINAGAKLGKDMLSPSARGLYNAVEEAMLHKYLAIYDKFLPRKEWARALSKYGGRTAKSAFASAMSEGAEEAVQYLNSKEDFASKYGWGGMSIGDLVINDIYQGSRVFNSYMALFGLTHSELTNDEEYWANWKGGFALGGLHTGAIRLGVNVADAYKSYGVTEEILKSSIMNRELDKKDRAANMQFALFAMQGKAAGMMDAIDYLEENDRRRENPYFSQEDYDEKRKAVREITRLTNDPDIKQRLEAKGILYDTNRYAAAIADLYNLQESLRLNTRESMSIGQQLTQLYNSQEFIKAADEIVDRILLTDPEQFTSDQLEIIKAGNDAVSNEIDSAKEAGIDTGTKEFNDHLNQVRKKALETAKEQNRNQYKNNILYASQLASKLKALLKLKQQGQSIEDFYNFLSDKFNIKPMRPDAKLIRSSVDELINNIKHELAKIDSRLNVNLSDQAIIDHLNSAQEYIRINEDEAERLLIAQGMLESDSYISQKYLEQYTEGLVRTKEGKYEYNPKKYKEQNARIKDLNRKLRNKEITEEEYKKQIEEDLDIQADPKDVENNPYAKKIDLILKTREENARLDWAVNDIANGDGITAFMELLAEEERKQSNSEEVKSKAKLQQLASPIDDTNIKNNLPQQLSTAALESQTPTTEQPGELKNGNVKEKLAKNREEYEKRKLRAKKAYERRKNRYKRFKRGNLNSTIVPFLDALVAATNVLIKFAETGIYKFAQYVQDLKDIIQDENIIERMLEIKREYIKRIAYYNIYNPSVVNNMSTTEEVMLYSEKAPVTIHPPVPTSPLHERIQNLLIDDAKNINTKISTHHDVIVNNPDGTVTVYLNYEAIEKDDVGNENAQVLYYIRTLMEANTSDESFENKLKEIFYLFLQDLTEEIKEFVKHRENLDVIAAIARHRITYMKNTHIQRGEYVRTMALAIILGQEDQIDPTTFPGDYAQFKRDVLSVKTQLEKQGLTIIDANRYIYGKDSLGRNISSLVDILAADDKDNIHVIKVRYSVYKIREQWDDIQPKAGTSIKHQVTLILKLVETILSNKFNIPVRNLSCLPVNYERSTNTLYVDKAGDDVLIHIKADIVDNSNETLDQLKQDAKNVVDWLNTVIDEYNSEVDEALRYTDEYAKIPHVEFTEFGDEESYRQYLNNLSVQLLNINTNIANIRSILNQHINEDNEVWLNSMETFPDLSEEDLDSRAAYEHLINVCTALDVALREVPSLKVTTQVEKDNVRYLYLLIYDAQVALDTLLQDPNALQYDVRHEEELITTALEKLAENKENFGRLSVMVREWWVTNFAIGTENTNTEHAVRSIGRREIALSNKVSTWIETVRDHVLNELDGSIPLLQWYSAILNNYFSVLLDNEEQVANQVLDVGAKQGLLNQVRLGRELIQQFNEKYDMRPETEFQGPPESPAFHINRMPTRWKNHYAIDTSHSPSFNEMQNNGFYKLMSQTPGFAELAYFNLYEKNGKVMLYIKYHGPNGKVYETDLSFFNDINASYTDRSGKTHYVLEHLLPEDVEWWNYVNQQRERVFIPKALAAIRLVNSNRNRFKLVFDVVLDAGSINYDKSGTVHNVTEFLFKNNQNQHDLYTISLDRNSGVGILVTILSSPNLYRIRTGKMLSDDLGGYNTTYNKGPVQVRSGMLVYMYNTGDGDKIGVPLQMATIGDDAAKLVYLMERLSAGEKTINGYDILALLKQRLYIADPNKNLTKYNNIENMIVFNGKEVVIGNESYNFVDKKQQLIDRISRMTMASPRDLLQSQMNSSNDLVLSRVRQLFSINSSTESITLPNGIVLNREDFTHKNQDGSYGSTWLGYLMRNNYLITYATGSNYRQMNIKNLRVEDNEVLKKEELAPVKPMTKTEAAAALEDLFGELDKTERVESIDITRGVEEQEGFINDVNEFFDKVLGKSVAREFVNNNKEFLGRVARNRVVLGECTECMVRLSTYAPESVAWHEAFHMLFELIIPPSQRDAFYNAYKKRSKWFFSKPTDREAAEYFADLYMTYMQNQKALDKADKFYKKIIPWLRQFGMNMGMYLRLGKQRTKQMYQLYSDVNEGRFADKEITKEQSDRFKLFFGRGLHYEVKNTKSGVSAEFKHIHNVSERDALVKGISFLILRAFGMDRINADPSKLKISSYAKSQIFEWEYLEDSTISGTLEETDNSETSEKPKEKKKVVRSTLDRIPKGILDVYLKEGEPDENVDAGTLALRELFEKTAVNIEGETREVYNKFEAISGYVADYIEGLLGVKQNKRVIKGDDDPDTDDQGEDYGENQPVLNSNIEKFDMAAFEFSKIDTMSELVKLFFATIPYSIFLEINGQKRAIPNLDVNSLGIPMLMPLEETYKMVVNKCHTASTLKELNDMLCEYAQTDPMFRRVFDKFHMLVYGKKQQDGTRKGGIYTYDQDGNLTSVDYDSESLALQILQAVHSQKIDFVTALSSILKNSEHAGRSVRVVSSSLDRDSKRFPDMWTQYLVAGQVGVFSPHREYGNKLDANGNKMRTQLVFRPGMVDLNGVDIFKKIAQFFRDVQRGMLSSEQEIEIDGVKYSKISYDDIDALKTEMIFRLNQIGIMFSKKALDNMLTDVFGGAGAVGITRWLNSMPVNEKLIDKIKKSSINGFVDKLQQFVSPGGVINQSLIEDNGYGDIGFVKLLAEYQGIYNRITTQNMALALNGKKVNSISQNNSISHNIDMFNTHDMENDTIKTLTGFGFNMTGEAFKKGSIILKNLADPNSDQFLLAHVYLGFKTDNYGDQGSEYNNTATIEDYVAKLTMLLQGYMISPTLADKSTWVIISGVDIPGMRFVETTDNNGTVTTSVLNAPSVRFINGKPYIVPNDAVINQMLEYAETERLAIQQCMEDLGYDEIPGYEKQGRHVLSEDEKIVNYHTKNKSGVEPNGTRFTSLTKIVCNEWNELTKQYELRTYNLNDPRMSSVDALKLANDHFFNIKENGKELSPEELLERQKEIMMLTLNLQFNNEVDTAVELGLVERVSYGTKVKVKETDDTLLNLDTKLLNADQIDALMRYYMKTLTTTSGNTWAKANSILLPDLSKMARSLAIASILSDATARHIISTQEYLRCFIGHPAMFKINYDLKNGKIKDSAFDIQKRIGGLVSTGDDNAIGIPGIPSEYTCAECKDYEVGSKSGVMDRLETMFVENQMRYVYGIRTGDWDAAYDTKNVDDLYKKRPDLKDTLDRAKQDGKKFAKSFDSKINVADGAAYITETMCENMLRMRGAYNNQVKKAFDILRNTSNQKYSWKDSAEAYKIIYEAVNLVPTKYTAYGFRRHERNGSTLSDIAVPYYNKYALFPLFPCIATGRMEKLYNKMLTEGVDMLMMNSAVKVGSLGAVEFDGEEIKTPFNVYRQKFDFIRRQLNTDPEEGDKITMGTQMIKIILQNLVLGRNNYKDAVTGETVSGEQILYKLMGAIQRLAEIGVGEVNDMFFTNGSLDQKKLSTFLNDLLTARNANKTLIQAILTKLLDDKEVLNVPLAATTDASWIESILISTINKRVIDIQTPGSSFVQRSVFAIEDGTIKSDAEAGSIYGGKRLEMINEDGSMDAVISIDFFEDILPEGLSFNEARQWLIDQGLIGGTATTVAYRIPTQAQSSIHALRFVDVVSTLKTTIILPEEFTKITGSDFDIDHLYLARYNYKKNEDGSISRDFEEGKKEYYQNQLLDTMMTLLKDVENSINTLYKSIDNDTELVTNVADQIQEYGSTKDDPFNFGTLHEQVVRKNDYITGKKGIGPFALNVTNQILTRLYGVSFKETAFTRVTGIMRFDKMLDVDDNAIDSWLSAFINAHVDIVKDPYISKLNVNPFTYNMLNMLIRSGWGEDALWFLALPVIREMAMANDRANSQYAKDVDNSKKGGSSRDRAISEAVNKHVPEQFTTEEIIKAYTISTKAEDISEKIRVVNWLKSNRELLSLIATGKFAGTEEQLEEILKTVFYAWKALEKYSIALGDFVQHTKIDTRKHGKSIIAINRYLRDYNKIFHPTGEDRETTIWDLDSLERLERRSWIGYKTRNAISLPMKILQSLTFTANTSFITAVLELSERLSYDGRKMNETGLTKVSRALLTAIKSKYFIDYAHQKLGMTDLDIKDMFIGNKSISRRLVALKSLIQNNPDYAYLLNNTFLNQVFSPVEDKPVSANGRSFSERPAFITVLDNVDDNRVNQDLLSEGWLELLNDSNKFVSKFARQLIVYAFLTSGEYRGWNKMLKYVPYEFISGEVDPDFKSYSDYIKEKLESDTNYEEFFDDVVSNNFMDYNFVKKLKEVNDDGTRNFIHVQYGVKIGAGIEYKQRKESPMYISVRIPNMPGRGVSNYELYKRIMFVKHGKQYYPIYVKIKKMGYHKTGYDIYEYGWNFNYAENEGEFYDNFNFSDALTRVRELLRSGAVDGLSDKDAIAISAAYYGQVQAEEAQPAAKQKSSVFEGAHLATRGYRKGDPQKHPEFNYVFTENAQAYVAYAPQSESVTSAIQSGQIKGTPRLKLNVSDVNGTNQAGIRTDALGNITENAYGIVVKKFLQDETGNFVSQEGVFLDTDEDFELFKSLNEDVFNRLDASPNKVIVFPTLMAYSGKAALPKRFAEWLRDQLSEKYGIKSEVKENVNNDYEGFGLVLTGVSEVENDNLPGPETKINIYAGTGENADLSNFAKRRVFVNRVVPHDTPLDANLGQYDTVEGAFQAQKLRYANYPDNLGGIKDQIAEKLQQASGPEARKIGRQILYLDRKMWDANSSHLMKVIIKASFEQNPQALLRLLATGNATLTHTQDKGKWGTEFPRILMEVREELRKELSSASTKQNDEFNNTDEFSDEEMKHCKG